MEDHSQQEGDRVLDMLEDMRGDDKTVMFLGHPSALDSPVRGIARRHKDERAALGNGIMLLEIGSVEIQAEGPRGIHQTPTMTSEIQNARPRHKFAHDFVQILHDRLLG